MCWTMMHPYRGEVDGDRESPLETDPQTDVVRTVEIFDCALC